MSLEHHLVGGYVRYISPHIIIIINEFECFTLPVNTPMTNTCMTYNTLNKECPV